MGFLVEVSGPPITETLPPGWIFERIEEWNRRFPNRFAFAIDLQDKVEEYGYADVLAYANSVAALLDEKGTKPGDRVGILMENIPQWVFVLLGAMRLGAVAVPLATTLPESSIHLLAEHAGCTAIFADQPNFEKASNVAKKLNCSALSCPPIRNPRSAVTHFNVPNPNDTALLIYTSGTTGNPKGVELTYDNLNYEISGAIEALQLSPDHRILSILPFSHVLPLIANALGPMCMGAGVVFLSSISPQRVIDAFQRHRITLFICVPQFFYLVHKRIFTRVAAQPFPMRFLFERMRALSRRLANPSTARKLFSRIHQTIGPELQFLASGGSRCDPRVMEDLNELGYTFLQAYGLTETSAAATITPVRGNEVGTVGKPIRGVTVRIESPNEEGVGEVCVRGPIVMKGYYLMPEQTSEAIRNGWFYTGDLGFIRHDGNLVITGRSKDVIVLASGKKAYPEELETHYSQSTYIKEICIMGLTDAANGPEGETLHAIVVPDMDEFRRLGQTNIQEMIRFEIENLSRKLPSYYRIHSLTIRNEPLPRTVTRKLKRFEIHKEESGRQQQRSEKAGTSPEKDHAVFQEGIGAAVARLIREAKPEAGPLDPAMTLELDLGFDSLSRVELFGQAENHLNTHIDEERAARIFTVGDLIEVLSSSKTGETTAAVGWKEKLALAPDDPLTTHYIQSSRTFLNPVMFVAMRTLQFLSKIGFRLRHYGSEKLPRTLPFILCPNHLSFLDGPLLISTLPRRIIYNIFILGYSDYWQNAFSRWLAEICNIVAIDPNANLVRALQVAAAGLKSNRVLLVFPEGTRSINGRVAEFRKGAAILAFELGIPIVPVGIRGTYEAWPRAGRFRFHPVEIHYGEPIHPGNFRDAADPYGAITDRLRNDVKILAGEP
jgi:long-chain acyl-CoA synthetase